MKPNLVEKQGMKQTDGCGLFGIYPKFLRSCATSKAFLVVYGLLGMVQAMSFIYIVVTLTTLEKRFKIPSRTTGLILSGNEISQILSLILMYYGGAGHRPRWLATGVGFSAASCFVLALPHIIYGPGKDAKALTHEYLDSSMLNSSLYDDLSLCHGGSGEGHCDEEDLEDSGMVPRLLIFLSQFILGVGTTLYFGLGQTYLDDNTKKKNTPFVLGCTFSLRTVGPAVGFVLGYACLNLYIDPSLHPVIDQKDPRWLGAWWLGWLLLGSLLSVFTFLIAMFPRELTPPPPKKSKKSKKNQELGEEPLKMDINFHSSVTKEAMTKELEAQKVTAEMPAEEEFKPSLSDFPKTLKRILSNKIIMCNCMSAMCAIFGFTPYITFLTKYLEVQFSVSAAGGSMMTGTVSLIGMVIGFLLSGWAISKFKPGASKLLSWNVVVALIYFFVIISFAYVKCDGPNMQGVDLEKSSINFTTTCNSECNCGGVKFSPVCHEASMTTFFSACHAGCTSTVNGKDYGNCTCVPDPTNPSDFEMNKDFDFVKAGPCPSDCTRAYFMYAILSTVTHILMSSGKIGNVLVNYRCVEKKDKSFAQGVTLMMLSLFALIPAPILFGALIDSTCLIWDESCGSRGNCWYYDRDKFRIIINYMAAGFTLFAAILDGFVCYLARNLDLYGLNDDKRLEFVKDIMPPVEPAQIEINGTPKITEKNNTSESLRL